MSADAAPQATKRPRRFAYAYETPFGGLSMFDLWELERLRATPTHAMVLLGIRLASYGEDRYHRPEGVEVTLDKLAKYALVSRKTLLAALDWLEEHHIIERTKVRISGDVPGRSRAVRYRVRDRGEWRAEDGVATPPPSSREHGVATPPCSAPEDGVATAEDGGVFAEDGVGPSTQIPPLPEREKEERDDGVRGRRDGGEVVAHRQATDFEEEDAEAGRGTGDGAEPVQGYGQDGGTRDEDEDGGTRDDGAAPAVVPLVAASSRVDVGADVLVLTDIDRDVIRAFREGYCGRVSAALLRKRVAKRLKVSLKVADAHIEAALRRGVLSKDGDIYMLTLAGTRAARGMSWR